MVNYLWPSLTILFAVLFNRVQTRWWLFPGLIVAFAGIVVILAGGNGFSIADFILRFQHNPVSYLLGLSAAVTWAAFSSMTKAWGGNTNPSTFIFAIDTTIFGLLWLSGLAEGPTEIQMRGLLSVLFGGIAIGVAYAAWTHGMSKGNITILAAASYFTPVLSCVFAMFWINAQLDSSFWSGVRLSSLVRFFAGMQRNVASKRNLKITLTKSNEHTVWLLRQTLLCRNSFSMSPLLSI